MMVIQYVKDDWQWRFPEKARHNRYRGASRPAYVFLCFVWYVIKDALILFFYFAFRFYKFVFWDIWNWIFKIDERLWFIRLKEKLGIYSEDEEDDGELDYEEDIDSFYDTDDFECPTNDNSDAEEHMTIIQEIRAALQDTAIGTELTSTQIKDAVSVRFGRNRGSIIPSDYCYNRLNNGIVFEKALHLFEYTANKTYIYLGEDCPYTGKIYHKPMGCGEIYVGEWKNGVILGIEGKMATEQGESTPIKEPAIHRTHRDASISMRYQVFKRDNFKCCSCGASPAKDPAVELHIDHIIPWSKGGETVMSNLQTLCSRCNLGKSDKV